MERVLEGDGNPEAASWHSEACTGPPGREEASRTLGKTDQAPPLALVDWQGSWAAGLGEGPH